MQRDTCFYHPDLRRMPEEECEGAVQAKALLDQWVRVELIDKRVFIGTLKAIDRERNLVLSMPVEIRPTRDGGQETKAQRGCLMFKPEIVVSVSKRIEQLEIKNEES